MTIHDISLESLILYTYLGQRITLTAGYWTCFKYLGLNVLK